MRPLSFPISWVFINLGISANMTTLASIVLALIGCGFLATGNYSLAIIGGILVNSFPLLDCVDGNIARAQNKRSSSQGKLFDQIADPFVYTFVYPCIGLGLYFGLEDHLVPVLGAILSAEKSQQSHMIYPFLGGITSSVHLLRKYLDSEFEKLRALKSRAASATNKSNEDDDSPQRPSLRVQKLYILEANLFHSGGFMYPVLLVALLLNYLSLYLICHAFLQVIDFVLIFYRRLRFLRSMEVSK
jgi:hypothetical protein